MQQDDGYFTEITDFEAAVERAKPNPRPIYHKGELVRIKDRWFRVRSFKGGFLTLKGLPIGFVPDPSQVQP